MLWILLAVAAGIIFFSWITGVSSLVEEVLNMKITFNKKMTEFYHSGKKPSILTPTGIDNRATWNMYNTFFQEITGIAQAIEDKNKQIIKWDPRKSQAEIVSAVKEAVEAFNQQMQSIGNISTSQMIDIANYGRCNRNWWDSVCAMTRQEAEYMMNLCVLASEDKKTYDKCLLINPEQMLRCVWFFALEKPYSVADFNKACTLFEFIYKGRHEDFTIAKLYATKQIGGEDAIRDNVRTMLKQMNSPERLTLLASSLMWMKAYQSENLILQHMLTSGMEMTSKTQERLHSLTNGGGKAPSGFDVRSSDGSLYFDVSALAWKDDAYIGMFENLSFQDKTLSYSLALRNENKDLFIPQGIKVPGMNSVLDKITSVFGEEYGSDVVTKSMNCIALSGSGEERMEGVLVFPKDCTQLGVLLHIARIGKKLIITFYTLFMPTGSDLAVQKQQVLSMYNKLSPTVTMWENSLKDTMLMAIEQLLNTTTHAVTDDTNNAPSYEEPIF